MPDSEVKKATMAQRRELRAAVRAAALARVKRDGVTATAKYLGVVPRTIHWWKQGVWMSYPAAVRFAPMLGVKTP